jgi:large subunit ribosomal protein L20
LRQHNVSYSVFIGQLGKHNIGVNRKMLAELAVNEPTVFDAVVAEAQA